MYIASHKRRLLSLSISSKLIYYSKPVEPTVGFDHRPALLSLKRKNVAIVVLLAEGFEGQFVRSVIEQVMPYQHVAYGEYD